MMQPAKPCGDRNTNICVAEGCYGEACIKGVIMGMTLESAPIGTVIQVGHPGNNHTATKRSDLRWYSNATGDRLSLLDPRDVTNVIHIPGQTISN